MASLASTLTQLVWQTVLLLWKKLLGRWVAHNYVVNFLCCIQNNNKLKNVFLILFFYYLESELLEKPPVLASLVSEKRK